MAANVENMFSVRETPWHGLGTIIEEAPTSADAIRLAGLDWEVIPRPIYDGTGKPIEGYKVNTRSSDNQHLGIVTNRYKIVQNSDAFAFTDALLGEGVRYETAGSLASGKRVWMLARMERTTLAEENIDPFLVFTNTHDGTGAIQVAVTPIRVVCQNTLNLALSQASRRWSCAHKGDVEGKLEEAREVLSNASKYMEALEESFGELKLKKVTDSQVKEMTDRLVELEFSNLAKKVNMANAGGIILFSDRMKIQKQEDKLNAKKAEILFRYNEAPDLVGTEKTAFRFINAVSDYATHTTDHRNTRNYSENLFMKTIDGNSLIDTAVKIAMAA